MWSWVGYVAAMIVLTLVGLSIAAGPTGPDLAITNFVVAHRTDNLTTVISAFSELFSPLLVSVWGMCAAVVLLVRDRSLSRSLSVGLSVLLAGAVAELIKLVVNRPRPPAMDQPGVYEAANSYPSGHVTGTAAVLIAIALAATVGHPRATRRLALAFAMAMTLLIAATRVYLGVHWTTDVLAGLLVGALTALVITTTVPGALTVVRTRYADRLPGRLQPWLRAPQITAEGSV
jgi:membrane-associated phospholipid phosphatase